jgi:hypothetical protein
MERVEAAAVTGLFQGVAAELKLLEPSQVRDKSDPKVGRWRIRIMTILPD